MGFFSKIGKGIKTAFKSIGKGIKSAFKKFGKFMGKIGIVGQLALMFTPIGAMIGSVLSGIGGAAGTVVSRVTGVLAKGGKVAQAAGKVLEAGASFAKAGSSAFKTITKGVESFVGEFSKTALKKIPGMENIMPSLTKANDNFFTADINGNSAWNTVQNNVAGNASKIVSRFKDGLKNFGDAGRVFTADGAAQLSQAQAQVGVGGRGTIPSSTAQESLLTDPEGKWNISQDERFAFDGEYGKQYQAQLDAGTTNLSASTQPGMVDPGAFEFPKMDMEGMNVPKPTVSSITKPDMSSVNKSFSAKLSEFPSTIKDTITGKYDKFLDNRSLGKALAQEGTEYAFDTVTGQIESDINTRLSQELGIVDRGEAPVSYGTYVEAYQAAGIGDYGSPQTNDRAMQMSIDPQAFLQSNPYGYGANIYQQQMNIRQGGTA